MTLTKELAISSPNFSKNENANIRPRRMQSGACSDFAEASRMSMERSFMRLQANYGFVKKSDFELA